MEKEELLHGKTKMKGLRVDSDSDEEIEIFNRRRPGNQGKSCEFCGALMVVLCLTFFATTIIFGARYLSALREIELLDDENTRLQTMFTDPELPNNLEESRKIVELRDQLSEIKEKLTRCQAELNKQQSEDKTTVDNGTENIPTKKPESKSPSKEPSALHETPKNLGTSYFQRFEVLLVSLLLVVIHRLLTG